MRTPTLIANLTVPETVEHLAGVIEQLETPPILGHQETWVDYSRDDRAPLLFIAGGEDHIMPASVNKSNAKHYKKSAALTDSYEFPGRSHWTCAEPGWEAVADYALDWATKNAR